MPQIAYQYAKRGANLVLVARRDHRLRAISEHATSLGAPHVLKIAADVVKEEDCRRFINETINCYGRLNTDINFWGNVYPTHVALPYLRESNGRIVVNTSVENWLPLPRMSLYSAAKSALMNFYETLRFELKEDVGITVATHGWIGTEMRKGKFMMEEGAEMQWKEEREGQRARRSRGGVREAHRLRSMQRRSLREVPQLVRCILPLPGFCTQSPTLDILLSLDQRWGRSDDLLYRHRTALLEPSSPQRNVTPLPEASSPRRFLGSPDRASKGSNSRRLSFSDLVSESRILC
ncbi:11-beta-hydroxysteroid dehydrogenase B [Orobanche hederae]